MDKVEKLKIFCEKINFVLDDFIKLYQGEYFPKTKIEKYSLFSNILNRSLSEEQQSFIDNVCNLNNRDSRTPSEYARDLVVSWLVEDVIKSYLNLKNNGADAERNFLKSRQIKYDSDFKLNDRYLELYVNFTDYWIKQKKIDLRMDKHAHLVKHKSLLLGIAFNTYEFFMIDFGKEDLPFYENYNYFWKKKCFTCDKYDKFYDISELKNYLSYFG